MSDPDFEDELARLRAFYRVKLREELAALAAMLDAVREGASAQDLAVARALAHRLRGTSGSYGFDESCAALECIEDQLERLPEAGAPDPAAAWVEIDRALVRARTELG